MPLYEYIPVGAPSTGAEVAQVYASMKTPPPERIVLAIDGTWRPATEADADGDVWKRHYSMPAARVEPDASLNYGDRLPASRSLPRRQGGQIVNRNGHHVREHPDGAITDLQGRPIIDSKAAREREKKRTGFIEADGD